MSSPLPDTVPAFNVLVFDAPSPGSGEGREGGRPALA